MEREIIASINPASSTPSRRARWASLRRRGALAASVGLAFVTLGCGGGGETGSQSGAGGASAGVGGASGTTSASQGSGSASGGTGGAASSGSASASSSSSGGGGGVDPKLPPEPTIPPACKTLLATKTIVNGGLAAADEGSPDTAQIQAAINACPAGQSVKLATSGAKNGFLSGPLTMVNGVTLWVDVGATLFASRNPRDFDVKAGAPTCGTDANNDSGGCLSLINVKNVANVGVMGDGVIDGRGGEPMTGGSTTWWDVAQDAKVKGVSHSNPRLVDVKGAQNFTLYKITLHNSPKFHVVISSAGYIAWGVTILTPSAAKNSVGTPLSPFYARNTDGIDPNAASDGFVAYCKISTGDDQIALKGGSGPIKNLTIAHNHFGTGHGMSIGSETNAGVSNVNVYDLSIDGTIPNGGAPDVDVNGLRIKSDPSRGGLVTGVTYSDVCIRGVPNPIVVNPNYSNNPGNLIPDFKNITFNDIHVLTAPGSAVVPVVTLDGYDAAHVLTATLSNVIVDGIKASDAPALNAAVTLGSDPVNFTPAGMNVTVKNMVSGSAAPNPCTGKFVTF